MIQNKVCKRSVRVTIDDLQCLSDKYLGGTHLQNVNDNLGNSQRKLVCTSCTTGILVTGRLIEVLYPRRSVEYKGVTYTSGLVDQDHEYVYIVFESPIYKFDNEVPPSYSQTDLYKDICNIRANCYSLMNDSEYSRFLDEYRVRLEELEYVGKMHHRFVQMGADEYKQFRAQYGDRAKVTAGNMQGSFWTKSTIRECGFDIKSPVICLTSKEWDSNGDYSNPERLSQDTRFESMTCITDQ